MFLKDLCLPCVSVRGIYNDLPCRQFSMCHLSFVIDGLFLHNNKMALRTIGAGSGSLVIYTWGSTTTPWATVLNVEGVLILSVGKEEVFSPKDMWYNTCEYDFSRID
jgi:hypothetical protein